MVHCADVWSSVLLSVAFVARGAVAAAVATPGSSSCSTEAEDSAMLQASRQSPEPEAPSHGEDHPGFRASSSRIEGDARGVGNEPEACVVKAPPKSALIVVDMQNDFINGTLPVSGGKDIIPTINRLVALEGWAFVGFTTDYHPHDHASFAASHASRKVFSRVTLEYTKDGKLCSEEFAKAYKGSVQSVCRADEIEHSLEQTLWPTHCVQNTVGQKIHHDVLVPDSAVTVRKGFSSVVDSYGAFENRIGTAESNLATLMRLASVKTVYVTGLALDYCVKFTSLQAGAEGFETLVVGDATKPVTQATGQQALQELEANGIKVVESASLSQRCQK